MKRRGMLAVLLPLSVLLIIATTIYASPTTHRPDETTRTEVKEPETISPTIAKTTWKSSSTVSPITTVNVRSKTNQPEVTTSTVTPLVKLSFDDPEDNTKELLSFKDKRLQDILKFDKKISPSDDFPGLAKPIVNPKDALLQEIQTLDDNESNNQKIQEAVAKVIKAEAHRTRSKVLSTTSAPIHSSTTDSVSSTSADSRAMKELLEAETDVTYNDDSDDSEDDDDDDDDDDDSDEDDSDEYNDDDDDDDSDDDFDDEEDIMTNCPDYCTCSGQYAAATRVRCSKLVEKQSFGPTIAHLTIENAGEIKLGPHALRARNLERLETIKIVDTRISEIDRTAFDGISNLFAVNLSRANLFTIHSDTFQNNTQLNLLTIAGNPLDLDLSGDGPWKREYMFDAPKVTEFDFSWNGRQGVAARLPKSAFSKMPNLAYLNLKQNQLTKLDRSIFKPLTSLVELDLSGNLLTDLPIDAFERCNDLQSLKVAGNFLTTFATIKASALNSLDVSNNRIKIITKSDLNNLLSLEQLLISGNGMKRIHQHAFSELDQLQLLDISNNKLSLLTEHHLRNNPRLEVLLMNDNPELKNLPVFKVNGFERNVYNIYRVECTNCGLESIESGTFNAMPALIHLNLAKNRLTGLPKGLFEPLSSLRELDLSENMIFTIPPRMLQGATSLTKLNLAGNPLVTLQVTPFLETPELQRLDVDRCQLRRVWSEARQPIKSLRYLSLRGNALERITVEELKAMPKLSGLDISQNPLNCDAEFNEAIQWLKSHGVTPTETVKLMNQLFPSNSHQYSTAMESITRWSDLAKLVCEDDEFDDEVSSHIAMVMPTQSHLDLLSEEEISDEEAAEISKADLEIKTLNHEHNSITDNEKNIMEDPWIEMEKNIEYEDYSNVDKSVLAYHRDWYSAGMWSVLTVGFVTLGVLLIIIQFARFMASRRESGRGPVIRPPLILRQGLGDNKTNCGLVYKPLQEEIPTPQMPKKGISGYSRGPFHYKQIVPESN